MKSRQSYTSNNGIEQGTANPLRRKLLQFALLAPFSTSLFAQSAGNAIAVQKLHTFGLRVTDVERSVAFYQQVFGMPVQARVGDTVCLQIGDGPRFISLRALRAGEQPGITHIGLSVPNFNTADVSAKLRANGFRENAAAAQQGNALDQSMQYWPVNDQVIAFADAEGLNLQLCAPTYCGNPAGQCQSMPPENSGLMVLDDINHFTNYMSHAPNANQFYLNLFGLQYQSYQGPTMPTVGVGDGKQFLMYVGGAADGRPSNPARIDHVSMSVQDFTVEGIQSKLESIGITPRTDPANTPAMSHWVSLRMPNRGGAEGGTPEVYFSDPDGIHIQLQHIDYCGGGGYLGEDCAPLV